MKRNTLILLFSLCSLCLVPLQVTAQESIISIGTRGGIQYWWPDGTQGGTLQAFSGVGGFGMLDLNYTYYTNITKDFSFGAIFGLGIGYGNAGLRGVNKAQYDKSYNGQNIYYTTDIKFRQMESFLRLDVPLMLSFRAGGFVANVGPRLVIPVATSPTAKLTITEPSITATYSDGSVVPTAIGGQNLFDGKEGQPQEVKSYLPKANILLCFEAGWEWPIQQNVLGLQLFVTVGVSSFERHTPEMGKSIIEITPSEDGSGQPQMELNSVETLINDRRLSDFGVRLYYGFSFGKNPSPRSARDTRGHRNRFSF